MHQAMVPSLSLLTIHKGGGWEGNMWSPGHHGAACFPGGETAPPTDTLYPVFARPAPGQAQSLLSTNRAPRREAVPAASPSRRKGGLAGIGFHLSLPGWRPEVRPWPHLLSLRFNQAVTRRWQVILQFLLPHPCRQAPSTGSAYQRGRVPGPAPLYWPIQDPGVAAGTHT